MSISTEQKELVQQSFAQVLPIADQAASLFYNRLFELDPKLRPLFKSDMSDQQKKLMQTLEVAVSGLDNLSVLIPVLQRLAVRHVGYGVCNEHYETVGSALLWALEQGLGDAYTDDVHAAWVEVYGVISSVMMEAAASLQHTNNRMLDTNKRIMRSIIEQAINEQNLEILDKLVAKDFVEHVPFPGQEPGRDGLKYAIGAILTGFPDSHWAIDEQLAEGDTVVTRFTWTGTHRGDFLGIPATEKAINVWGVVIDVVRNGLFRESRLIMDMPGLMQQIG